MNHPLPQATAKSSMAYEFVKAITEEENTSVPERIRQDDGSRETIVAEVGEQPAARFSKDTNMAIDPNDAYETYRQRMLAYQAEQDESVRRTMPQPASRALAQSDIDKLRQREYYYDPAQYYSRAIEQQPLRSRESEPFFKSGFFNRGLAMAAAAAVVAGCGVGIALTKKDDIQATATRTMAYVGALLPSDQPAQSVTPAAAPASVTIEAAKVVSAETVISKKPISTASIDVADVFGAPNSSIPLTLRADPTLDGRDISIRISGLPENAMLTAGQKQNDRTWLLSDDELANVSIVVPDASIPKFDLSVAAIETKTGELASPVREMTVALTASSSAIAPAVQQTAVQQTVVQQTAAIVESAKLELPPTIPPAVSIAPANAAPELQGAAVKPIAAQASPIPSPIAVAAPVISAEARGLLEKGDVLLKAGDLSMARQFYLRAVDLGAPQGALGVAKTYDPAVFKELNVQGIVPDALLAQQWYRKASAAGLTDATQALARFDTTAALPQQ